MRRVFLLLLLTLSAFAATANFNGHKVHYTVTGNAKSTLVLIHGWTCDETFWSANVPELAKHYRVITVDLPGHGQSEALAEYSMDTFADAVSAVMKGAKVKRATIVGHSMGGPVALAFARRHRDQMTALVGVDAPFIDAASADRFKSFADRFHGDQASGVRKKMVDSMFTAATTPEVRERIARVMLAASPEVAYKAQVGLWSAEFWRDDVIDVPMLEVLAGTQQYITAETIRKRFPRAEVTRIKDTGHFLMMEKPDEFNRMLLEWLAKQN